MDNKEKSFIEMTELLSERISVLVKVTDILGERIKIVNKRIDNLLKE